jgi:hypothetical protein
MNKTIRKPRLIVNTFLRSKSTIQAEMLEDVARVLCDKHRIGSVNEMVPFLRKALSGYRLFQYEKGGQNFYETKEERRLRCGLTKWASVSDYINATEVELALV